MVRRSIGTTRHGVHWFEFAMKILSVLSNLFRTLDNWSYNAIFWLFLYVFIEKRTDTIGLFFFYKDDLAFFYREINLSKIIICSL